MTRPAFSCFLAFCVASSIGFVVVAAKAPPEDDPKAHALHDQMVKTMRDADSLSFEGDYRWDAQGKELSHVTYRVWLKKPNQFRVEASHFGSDKIAGVLVGDGDHLWVYRQSPRWASTTWPGPLTVLSDGGQVQMPLTKTFWSPCFGMVTDCFGVG